MPLDTVLSKLEGVRRSGNEYTARCPAHDDQHASLSVREADGKILLKCFTGCGIDAICQALKISISDLFEDSRPTPPRRLEVSSRAWEIRDCDSVIVAQHVRHNYADGGKSFSWHRNGQTGLNGCKTEDLPLYGCEHLKNYTDPEGPIVITEGEKACDSLCQRGVFALGTVTGAAGCPSPETLKSIAGLPNPVCLWPDNDPPGIVHMEKLAQRLHELGKPCYRIVWANAPHKGDAADYAENPLDIISAALSTPPYTANPKSSEAKRYKSVTETVTGLLQGIPTDDRYKNVTESVTETVTKPSQKACNVLPPLADRVADWVKGTSGWWGTDELDRDLGINGAAAKNNRRLILYRLKTEGRLESHAKINKHWRYVNTSVTALDFRTATMSGVLPIRWPLGIQDFVHLYPGNLVVVAGSPNSGKTAMLLNVLHQNQDVFPTYYFCSEMGSVELRDRLDKFPNMAIEDWHFEAIERFANFADVIRPDCLNVIDYLEMTENLFEVNTHLTAIHQRLGTGVAIVAIQKKVGAQYGRGQEFGLEKPKLYLSMDKGKLTIVKGKSWARKNVDPAGMHISFKIVDGCRFEATDQWQAKA